MALRARQSRRTGEGESLLPRDDGTRERPRAVRVSAGSLRAAARGHDRGGDRSAAAVEREAREQCLGRVPCVRRRMT